MVREIEFLPSTNLGRVKVSLLKGESCCSYPASGGSKPCDDRLFNLPEWFHGLPPQKAHNDPTTISAVCLRLPKIMPNLGYTRMIPLHQVCPYSHLPENFSYNLQIKTIEIKMKLKLSRSKTAPPTPPSSALKPLVLVDRLIKAQEPEPVPKKKRANPGTRLLRLIGLKKKKSEISADYVLVTKVKPTSNPDPAVSKPAFVVSRSTISHRQPIAQPLPGSVRVLPATAHRNTMIPRRVLSPASSPGPTASVSVSVLSSCATDPPIPRTRIPVGRKREVEATCVNTSAGLARHGVETTRGVPFPRSSQRVVGWSGIKPLRLSADTTAISSIAPSPAATPASRPSEQPATQRSPCTLCGCSQFCMIRPVSDRSKESESAQDVEEYKVSVEFGVQTDTEEPRHVAIEERVKAQEVSSMREDTEEVVAQTDSEKKFALAVEQQVVIQILPQQRQTTETEVQTEEQPVNAVDIVQGAKVTAEISIQAEEHTLKVVEDRIMQEATSSKKVTADMAIQAEGQPAVEVVDEGIVKEAVSYSKVTVEMAMQTEELAVSVAEEPIVQQATSSGKVAVEKESQTEQIKTTVEVASQTEETVSTPERQVGPFPVALPKNDARSMRTNLFAAIKSKPKIGDVSGIDTPKHDTTPTSSWSRMKRDSTGLLDELRDRLSRRNTPSMTHSPPPSTSRSRSSTPPKFAALRSRRPARKENAEPEEGELQQVFRSRKSNTPGGIPLGVVDANTEGSVQPSAESLPFGPRKLRRIVVPPVVEGSVPSRNPQIQSEIHRLRAQGKVGGGTGAGVGAGVAVGRDSQRKVENVQSKNRRVFQKIT